MTDTHLSDLMDEREKRRRAEQMARLADRTYHARLANRSILTAAVFMASAYFMMRLNLPYGSLACYLVSVGFLLFSFMARPEDPA